MITVMTPTYNRANLLYRLYDSLKKQANRDFEWLIVDDGSVDDTKGVVESFISEHEINIRYIYQENKGKAMAFNVGVENAEGELFLCVDSDDFLAENALEIIGKCSNEIKTEDIAGILALKQDLEGRLLGDSLPGIKYLSTFELSEKYGCLGEWSLIYKTYILKENLFPQIPDEKFITECVIYDKIAEKYKMLLLSEVITICEYQQDGLTGNIVKNMIKNPTGYKIFYKQRIDMAYTLKKRLGYVIRYNIFKYISQDAKYDYAGKHAALVKLFGFVGSVGKGYYCKKAECGNQV